MARQRYILDSASRPVGLPMAKDTLIGRARFDEGTGHWTSDVPSSYNEASHEVAEAELSR